MAAASGCRATDHAPRSSFYWVFKQLQSFVRTTKASAANETTIRYAQRQHRLVGPARTAFSVRPPPFAQAEQAVAAQKRVFISLASNRVWSSTLRSDTQSSTAAMVSVRLKRTELPHGSPTGAALTSPLLETQLAPKPAHEENAVGDPGDLPKLLKTLANQTILPALDQ